MAAMDDAASAAASAASSPAAASAKIEDPNLLVDVYGGYQIDGSMTARAECASDIIEEMVRLRSPVKRIYACIARGCSTNNTPRGYNFGTTLPQLEAAYDGLGFSGRPDMSGSDDLSLFKDSSTIFDVPATTVIHAMYPSGVVIMLSLSRTGEFARCDVLPRDEEPYELVEHNTIGSLALFPGRVPGEYRHYGSPSWNGGKDGLGHPWFVNADPASMRFGADVGEISRCLRQAPSAASEDFYEFHAFPDVPHGEIWTVSLRGENPVEFYPGDIGANMAEFPGELRLASCPLPGWEGREIGVCVSAYDPETKESRPIVMLTCLNRFSGRLTKRATC